MIAVSWATLRGARAVKRVLGDQGLEALTRIMGFLLVCIGVQFIGIGVIEVSSDPRVLGPILKTLESLRAT